jgi:hypothetical protein
MTSPLCLLAVALITGALCCQAEEPVAPTEAQQRIVELIEQLGAAKYRQRERAEEQLIESGIAAYEALRAASKHEDVEIRLRARHLVDLLRTRFLWEGTEKALQVFITDYDQQPVAERQSRITTLAGLVPQQGVELLTRIARFEDHELVSKQAALAIMRHALETGSDQAQLVAGQIISSAGNGDRTATRWLRAYADSLSDPGSVVPLWKELRDAEALQVAQGSGDSDETIARDLARLYCDVLRRADKDAEADQELTRLNAAKFVHPDDALPWLDWLASRSEWETIKDFGALHKEVCEQRRTLLYCVAEAHLRTGGEEEAERLASAAFAQAQDAMDHVAVSEFLEDERGLFPWAERELRAARSPAEEEALYRVLADLRLAELLHGQQQDDQAASVLEELTAATEQSQSVRTALVKEISRQLNEVAAQMHYLRACHLERQGDRQGQQAELEAGFRHYSRDIDLLIAMYRLPDPSPEWREKTLRAVRNAVRECRDEITEARRNVELAQSDAERQRTQRLLAYALNQYAWLVANTEGDQADALRASQQSLELRPGEAGFLDTLARCHFALGELDNALQYQRQAVDRSPHEGLIVRQLEFFQQASVQPKNR